MTGAVVTGANCGTVGGEAITRLGGGGGTALDGGGGGGIALL